MLTNPMRLLKENLSGKNFALERSSVSNEHETEWKEMAQKAHDYIKNNFPTKYDVHPEDISKALIPLLEVNDRLTYFLNESKLREKYWMKYFCDYILDRCWDEIHVNKEKGKK